LRTGAAVSINVGTDVVGGSDTGLIVMTTGAPVSIEGTDETVTVGLKVGKGVTTGAIVSSCGAVVSIDVGTDTVGDSDTGDTVLTIGAPVLISIGTGVIGDSDAGDIVLTTGAAVCGTGVPEVGILDSVEDKAVGAGVGFRVITVDSMGVSEVGAWLCQI